MFAKNRICVCAALVVVAALGASPAIADLLNPSFEDYTGPKLILTYDIYATSSWTNLQTQTAQYTGSTNPAWTQGNFDGILATGLTGTYYERLAGDPGNQYGAIAQSIGPMVSGSTYTVTADAFGGTTTTSGHLWAALVELRSNAANSGGTVYNASGTVTVVGGTKVANGLSVSYTAQPGDNGNALYVRFAAIPGGTGWSTRGGIDNAHLVVTAVPEPSTLILLGTGLLGLLAYAWRKRK